MTVYRGEDEIHIGNIRITKAVNRRGLFGGKRVYVLGYATASCFDEEWEFNFSYEGKADEHPETMIPSLQRQAADKRYENQRSTNSQTLYGFAKSKYPRIDDTLESDKPTIAPPPPGWRPSARIDPGTPPSTGSGVQYPKSEGKFRMVTNPEHEDLIKTINDDAGCRCIPHMGIRNVTGPGLTCTCGKGISYRTPLEGFN